MEVKDSDFRISGRVELIRGEFSNCAFEGPGLLVSDESVFRNCAFANIDFKGMFYMENCSLLGNTRIYG